MMAFRGSRCEGAAELESSEPVNSISSVAQDFSALVEIFEHQLELLPITDGETRSHLRRAKAAAERGAKLSKKLLGQIQSRERQSS